MSDISNDFRTHSHDSAYRNRSRGCCLAQRSSAHHSLASQFDESKPLTLQGVITKVEWVNPHVYLHIDVKDKTGTSAQWALETLPPAMLRRGGLRSDMLGKGEMVTVLALPRSKRIQTGVSPQDHVRRWT